MNPCNENRHILSRLQRLISNRIDPPFEYPRFPNEEFDFKDYNKKLSIITANAYVKAKDYVHQSLDSITRNPKYDINEFNYSINQLINCIFFPIAPNSINLQEASIDVENVYNAYCIKYSQLNFASDVTYKGPFIAPILKLFTFTVILKMASNFPIDKFVRDTFDQRKNALSGLFICHKDQLINYINQAIITPSDVMNFNYHEQKMGKLIQTISEQRSYLEDDEFTKEAPVWKEVFEFAEDFTAKKQQFIQKSQRPHQKVHKKNKPVHINIYPILINVSHNQKPVPFLNRYSTGEFTLDIDITSDEFTEEEIQKNEYRIE
ncbi:hypothetical protein GPJ56_007306 [Histomonas meleagridis]|uniref:uncharacterized protein n=1 Tax=Histomonas meleagridis TaxID=135588 RepID=UPI00355A947D|nr:hypothetical protein GPJ56_007306 [Histomonas meleagridis]KAH0804152.1 hypothetical protein GO595_002982 [Histomonas meleagridis]